MIRRLRAIVAWFRLAVGVPMPRRPCMLCHEVMPYGRAIPICRRCVQ